MFDKSRNHVEVERLANGARLLAAIEHGDGLGRRRQRGHESGGVERPVEAYLHRAELLAASGQVVDRLFDRLGPRTHEHDDALGVGCANVVKQMVLPAGQPRELVHRLLDGVGAGDVVRVGALAGLEVDVRVLGRAAHDGMVGRQGAVAVGTNQVIVDHRPHDGFVDGGDLVDLVRGAEAVEEVDERHAGAQRGCVGDEGHVHRFLHRVGAEQGEAGVARRHHVTVVAEDGQTLRRQGAGGYVEGGRGQLAGDLEHVRDHQQQTLRGGEGRC